MRNFNEIVPKMSPNGPQILPKWSPNGLKTASKLVLEAFQGPNLILGSILGGIVLQFGLPRDLKKHQKSMIFSYLKRIQKIKCFYNNFSFDVGMNFKHFPNGFHSDSDPRLKMLMFRITAYLQWILMFFMERPIQTNKKKVLKTDRIRILFLMRFCMRF